MVEWICRPCHQKHHRAERAAENAAWWAETVRQLGIAPAAAV
jgi:hypothetical protein